MLKKARIMYDFEEVNMLKGDHNSSEFEATHPSRYIPILQDGEAFIYGNTSVMLAHICGKFKKQGEKIMPKEYKAELAREFSEFEENQKRTIKLLRRMLIAKKQGVNPPSDRELENNKKDFFEQVLPILNQKIRGKAFFVGD